MPTVVVPGPTDIERQWVKAKVLGALAVGAAGIVNVGAAKVAAPYVDELVRMVLAVVAGMLGMVAVILHGRLAGVVLRSKVPDFPMRGWMRLYWRLGAIWAIGSGVYIVRPFGETNFPGLGSELSSPEMSFGVVVRAFVGAAAFGAALGAFMGVQQATRMMDGPVQGLGTWIGYSILTGIAWTILVPVVLYGPVVAPALLHGPSVAGDLIFVAGMVVVFILAAYIMRPAVRALRPS